MFPTLGRETERSGDDSMSMYSIFLGCTAKLPPMTPLRLDRLRCLSSNIFIPERSEQIKVVSSYPATVCPAIGNKVSSIAGVTNPKIGRRSIDGVTKKLAVGKTTQIPLSNTSVL